MPRISYTYTYPVTCPGCGADFTAAGPGITVHCSSNAGNSLGEFTEHVTPDAARPYLGTLSDSEGLIAIGKHESARCARCGADLADHASTHQPTDNTQATDEDDEDDDEDDEYDEDAHPDAITLAEMQALAVHPGWSDGREGYLWCRFDAVIDAGRRLRAEITWDDDDEDKPTRFFDAELFLETNRDSTVAGSGGLVTWDGVSVGLDRETAITLVAADPAEILAKYAGKIAGLEFWDPAKGYGDGPAARREAEGRS